MRNPSFVVALSLAVAVAACQPPVLVGRPCDVDVDCVDRELGCFAGRCAYVVPPDALDDRIDDVIDTELEARDDHVDGVVTVVTPGDDDPVVPPPDDDPVEPEPILPTYSRWGDNEPNDRNGEDCGSVRVAASVENESGEWRDASCAQTKPFVCAAVDASKLDAFSCAPIDASRFTLCTAALTFDAAAAACAAADGELASILSDNENNALIVAGTTASLDEIWFGASDAASEADWRYRDGTAVPWIFSSWDFESEQPDGSNPNENCAAIGDDGNWDDEDCVDASDMQGFVCEAAGAPGALVNAPATCTLFESGRLAVCVDQLAFGDARAMCAAMQGELVKIETPSENAIVSAARNSIASIVSDAANCCWIGAVDNDVDGQGVWKWLADDAVFDRIAPPSP